jgi:hypothetical protein
VKFTKQILRPGKYVVRSANGKRSVEEISADRLRGIVDEFKRMRANGLRVPAPWRHDKSVPLAKDVQDSRDYGGFWEDSWIGDDGAWYGRLDVPIESDAEKVGATVTEVSPYILPEWTDGKGTGYKDAPVHIALVQHPVSPGQSNFQPAPAESSQPAMALALSMLTEGAVIMADEPTAPATPATIATTEPEKKPVVEPPAKATAPSIQDVLTALKTCGLELPEDTIAENLAERIVTAAKAIAGKKAEEEGTTEPGANQNEIKEQPQPIAMGGEIMPIDKTVSADSKTLSFASEEDCRRFQQQAERGLEFGAALLRERYQGRISNLIRTGRITPALAKQQLEPLTEGFELSLGADGKRLPTELDRVLEVLEAQPANAAGMIGQATGAKSRKNPLAGIGFANEEPMPFDYASGGEMTDERAEEVVNQQLEAAGQKAGKKE